MIHKPERDVSPTGKGITIIPCDEVPRGEVWGVSGAVARAIEETALLEEIIEKARERQNE